VTPEQLIAAVRLVTAGDALLALSITWCLEVLRLLACGLANVEIADALHLSEATAKTYVAHILPKLGLRDRVQAVVFAYETGLVRPGSG
jgi:DNA-binding CsgD family transcriptional regulator